MDPNDHLTAACFWKMIDAQYFEETSTEEYEATIKKIQSAPIDPGLDVFMEDHEMQDEESKIDRRMENHIRNIKLDRLKNRMFRNLRSLGASNDIDETLAYYTA